MPTVSDFTKDELTKYVFTDDAMGTRPTSWYVGLIKPNGDEVQGADDANYERQAVTLNMTGTPGRADNDGAISFPAVETGADYDIDRFAIFDASSGGNNLIQENLEFEKNVVGGNVVSFGAGDLVVGVGA